jgi:hypothetical protein
MAGLDGPAGTGGSADAASPAQDLIDSNVVFHVVIRDGLVGTEADAQLAPTAKIFVHLSRHRLKGQLFTRDKP